MEALRLLMVFAALMVASVQPQTQVPATQAVAEQKPPCSADPKPYTAEDLAQLHGQLDRMAARLLTGLMCKTEASSIQSLPLCRDVLLAHKGSEKPEAVYAFRANKQPVVFIGIQADGSTIYQLAKEPECVPTELERLLMVNKILLPMFITKVRQQQQ